MSWASLNVFQKLVRHWEKLHPYNGAQLLRIRGPVPSQLPETWHETLRDLGLGPVEVQGSRYRFLPPRIDLVKPQVLPADTGVDALLSESLNRPFRQGECPLRLLIVPQRNKGEDSYLLAIAYQHWVADSVAIRRVLRELFVRLYARDRARPERLSTSAGGYWKLFGAAEAAGGVGSRSWPLLQGLLAAIRQTARMKRVRRLETIESPSQSNTTALRDYNVRFSYHPLPDATLRKLIAFSKRHRVKVNDVLLAALTEAVAQHGPLTPTPKRQDLAVGTIVDLRPFAPSDHDLSDVFSLYLGFTTAFVRPQHLESFDSLTHTLARQHHAARSSLAACSSQIRMAAGLVTHALLRSDESVREFYRKRMPLSAGISNVNLNHDPLARFHPHLIKEFIRASPTGPMMPLVISASTLGNTFHFALTRRTAAVPDEMAARIISSVAERLSSL